ncbi:hypothetical protein KIN20_036170 [Parelaphostrongylus tenuis]|uniref:Uncharacterized protein n=1 Tax=Parelaphostrongylus tenuis TaxID=148309 RepID=A0AAD5RCT7_PARTN|nr:hypothetical protein KIN20_036170 [Parelaphostrongylus tenuis]
MTNASTRILERPVIYQIPLPKLSRHFPVLSFPLVVVVCRLEFTSPWRAAVFGLCNTDEVTNTVVRGGD